MTLWGCLKSGLVTGLLALAIAGCATVPTAEPVPPPAAELAPALSPPPPAPKPVDQQETRAPEPAATRPAPQVALTPRPHAPLPDSLIGASPETVKKLLGPPDLERREGQARLWTFRGGDCRLAIVFGQGEGGGQTVMALRVTEPRWGAPAPDAATCLQDLTS